MTRILDLSGPSGAYGTKLLADLGYEVIKIEGPSGDPMRLLPPLAPDADAPENSLWWAHTAAGKKSVVVDLETADGRSMFRSLARTADAVVESAGPGQLDRQGIGYRLLSHENAGLVWVGISPFGASGPKRDWHGSNLVAWAQSGVLYSTGFPESTPVVPGGQAVLACHTTAMNAAAGLLLALRARKQTGSGQFVDISMHEAVVTTGPETGALIFLDDQVPRPRGGNRRPITRPWGLYPTKDGWASVVVIQPAHWQAMAAWLDEVLQIEGVNDEIFTDMRMRYEAAEAIDAWTEQLTERYTKYELFLEGQRRGIPVTPVNTVADLNTDAHLAASGFFVETEHPALGSLHMPGAPIQLGDGPRPTSVRAPLLGEHTDEILGVLT